jgi:hypothetical protein
MDVSDLPAVFERRRSELPGTPSGFDLIDLFFSLAREPIQGYPPPDFEENVVRIESSSGPEFQWINLKRQMTRFDDDGEVDTVHFYVDLSFERLPDDPEIVWFNINYDNEPPFDARERTLDEVAAVLHANEQLMRILARHPQSTSSPAMPAPTLTADDPSDQDQSRVSRVTEPSATSRAARFARGSSARGRHQIGSSSWGHSPPVVRTPAPSLRARLVLLPASDGRRLL